MRGVIIPYKSFATSGDEHSFIAAHDLPKLVWNRRAQSTGPTLKGF